MITRVGESSSRAATTRRVASMPSSSGMRMSISTTSGFSRRAMSTACTPSTASPTTSMSSSASKIILKPARTSAWSSAIMMRTLSPDRAPRAAATGSSACASAFA